MKHPGLWGVLTLSVIVSNAFAAPRHALPVFALLTEQGFSRPLGPTTTIRRLGDLTSAGKRYTVYYYNHAERAAQVRHGRQAVILVENGTHYVGAYEANMAECFVRQNEVWCRDGDTVQSIGLSRGRLPARVLIGGELAELYK